MARRLKEAQKIELVEGYRLGKSSSSLAMEFGCSINTVNRIVKLMMTKDEYLAVKKLRIKEKTKNIDIGIDSLNGQLEKEIYKKEVELKITDSNDFNDSSFPSEVIQKEKSIDNLSLFKEVAPLISDFGFENNKQRVSLKSLNSDLLPQTVFMLVNQKVELEPKKIKDFPEWNFLPSEEQERQAILLFENQRAAKRNCSRGQRVIKVPDSEVFILTTSFLLSKGITRIIFDEQLISLDEEIN